METLIGKVTYEREALSKKLTRVEIKADEGVCKNIKNDWFQAISNNDTQEQK